MEIATENCTFGDFPTYALLDPDKTEFIEQLKNLLQYFNPKGTYPGPNPCSIEKSDLGSLKQSKYKVCEKTDGVRVLFVCLFFKGHKIAALVTRGFDVYVCPIDKCPRVWKQGTVFDGEIATIGNTPSFVGFDAIFVSGIPVWNAPLSKRLDAAKRSLVDYQWTPGEISISFKEYYDTIDEYLAHTDETRPEDGVILTPEEDPVKVGRHKRLFKMKPRGKHTVDFLLSNSKDLSVYNPGTKSHSHVASLQASVDLQEGSIVECTMSAPGIWTYVAVRTDKHTANDMLTYKKTMVNIEEDLTLDHIKHAMS
jgi:hypothetical protein